MPFADGGVILFEPLVDDHGNLQPFITIVVKHLMVLLTRCFHCLRALLLRVVLIVITEEIRLRQRLAIDGLILRNPFLVLILMHRRVIIEHLRAGTDKRQPRRVLRLVVVLQLQVFTETVLCRGQVAILQITLHHNLQPVARGGHKGEEHPRLVIADKPRMLQQHLPRGHGVRQMVEVHHKQTVQQAVFLMAPGVLPMVHLLRVNPLVWQETATGEDPSRQVFLGSVVCLLGGLGLWVLTYLLILLIFTVVCPAYLVYLRHGRPVEHLFKVLRRHRCHRLSERLLNTYCHIIP